MSKKYNQGAPKRRVIVAAEQEVKTRVRKGFNRGVRRGEYLGAAGLAASFNSMSLLKRLKFALKGISVGRV